MDCRRTPPWLAAALLLAGGEVSAQDPSRIEPIADAPAAARETEWIGGRPWWRWSRGTGSWAGLRDDLQERGIKFGGGVTMDWFAPWRGGVRSRDTLMTLLDVNLEIDLDALLGVADTTVFVDAYQANGRDASDDTGDFQGFSNIEARGGGQVSEVWCQTWLAARTFRAKVGKVDANSEFAFLESAGDFINSSAGFSPTIHVLPTFPDPAFGINLFLYPVQGLYAGGAIYDGSGAAGVRTGRLGPKTFLDDSRSNDYFGIAELGHTWGGSGRWGGGRAAIGGWHHTGEFARFSGGAEKGTEGFYVLFEQQVWRERPSESDDPQGLYLMASFAQADERVSEAFRNTLAGVTYEGPIPGREQDGVGLMVSYLEFSGESAAGFSAGETAIELFYRFQLMPFLAIKPDLQYVVHPSGSTVSDDVLIGGLRIEAGF